jgi:hypothetical protein
MLQPMLGTSCEEDVLLGQGGVKIAKIATHKLGDLGDLPVWAWSRNEIDGLPCRREDSIKESNWVTSLDLFPG